MNIRISVVQRGTTPLQFEKEIKMQFINVNKGMGILALSTADHMRRIISTSKRRSGSQNRLENSITVEPIGKNGFGIGNIMFMDRLAPYWFLINYGGFSAPALRGMTVPGFFGAGDPPMSGYKGTGVGHQKFTYARNTFMMKPESPIMAMNYIEKTKHYLSSVIRVHFSGWVGRTQIFK